MPRKIEISHKTIIFTVIFLICIWFLFYIREILIQFFVALLIMAILNPLVERLAKNHIPRALSILLVYLLFIGLVITSIAGIVPPLIEQTTTFVNDIPTYLSSNGFAGDFSDRIVNEIVSEIGRLPAQIARFGLAVFSDLFGILTVLIFAFYLLLARNKLDNQVGTFFDEKTQNEITRIVDKLEKRLGGWARGQLALVFLVGISTYVGLLLLGIPYALPLAILAGLLEIIPYLGPIISAIPAVIIGFGISPVMGFATVALAFLIQQMENYLFVPKVMQRSAGVSPIVTLLALAIGFKVAGIVGVFMSVPVVITLQVLIDEYVLDKAS